MTQKSSTQSITWYKRVVVTYRNGLTQCQPDFTSNSASKLTWTDNASGGENPGWRNTIRLGGDATTVFTGSRQKAMTRGSATLKAELIPIPNTCATRNVNYTGCIVGVPSDHLIATQGNEVALNQAKARLAKDIQSFISPVAGGQALGELKQTLHMIRHPALALRRSIDSYATSVKKRTRGLSDREKRQVLSRSYLEATFGWQPLIGDIRGGMKALEQLKSDRPQIRKFASSGSTRINVSGNQLSYPVVVGTLYARDYTNSVVTARAKCAARIQSSSQPTAAESFGLYPEEFVPTLWEIMPYSWLIDYFTNIGGIIEAWSNIQGRVIWANVTIRNTRITDRRDQVYDVSGWAIKTRSYTGQVPRLQTVTINRSSLGSIVPSLAFTLPGFGTLKSLNIAALLHSRVRL